MKRALPFWNKTVDGLSFKRLTKTEIHASGVASAPRSGKIGRASCRERV